MFLFAPGFGEALCALFLPHSFLLFFFFTSSLFQLLHLLFDLGYVVVILPMSHFHDGDRLDRKSGSDTLHIDVCWSSLSSQVTKTLPISKNDILKKKKLVLNLTTLKSVCLTFNYYYLFFIHFYDSVNVDFAAWTSSGNPRSGISDYTRELQKYKPWVFHLCSNTPDSIDQCVCVYFLNALVNDGAYLL